MRNKYPVIVSTFFHDIAARTLVVPARSLQQRAGQPVVLIHPLLEHKFHSSSRQSTYSTTTTSCRHTNTTNSNKKPWISSSSSSSSSSFFSTWTGRGHDLLADSFLAGDRPKVLLEAFGPSGFDVSNILKKIDPKEVAPHGALHMMGSIMVFPHACFLWNIEQMEDITMESLAPVLLHRPKVEFLFIGTAKPVPRAQSVKLKEEIRKKGNVVLEFLSLVRLLFLAIACMLLLVVWFLFV